MLSPCSGVRLTKGTVGRNFAQRSPQVTRVRCVIQPNIWYRGRKRSKQGYDRVTLDRGEFGQLLHQSQ